MAVNIAATRDGTCSCVGSVGRLFYVQIAHSLIYRVRQRHAANVVDIRGIAHQAVAVARHYWLHATSSSALMLKA